MGHWRPRAEIEVVNADYPANLEERCAFGSQSGELWRRRVSGISAGLTDTTETGCALAKGEFPRQLRCFFIQLLSRSGLCRCQGNGIRELRPTEGASDPGAAAGRVVHLEFVADDNISTICLRRHLQTSSQLKSAIQLL